MRLNIKKNLTSLLVAGFTVLSTLAVVTIGPAQAIGEGQIEGGDIYKIKNVTKNSGFANTQNADKCETLQYKIRLHNPGPGIVSSVNVKVSLPATVSTTNVSTVTITAQNAQPATTTGTATLRISTPQKVSYISGSTQLLNTTSNVISSLPDGITGGGVNIGNVGVSLNEIKFVQFQAKTDCPPPPPPPCTPPNPNCTPPPPPPPPPCTPPNPQCPPPPPPPPPPPCTPPNPNCTPPPPPPPPCTPPNPNCTPPPPPPPPCTPPNPQCPPPPPPPVVSTGVCKLLDLVTLNKKDREVKATLSGEVKNATITGYKIDFGDGKTSDKSTDTHKYAKDGTYTVKGTVTIRFADGRTESKTSAACEKKVTFKKDVTPEIVPPPVSPPPPPPTTPPPATPPAAPPVTSPTSPAPSSQAPVPTAGIGGAPVELPAAGPVGVGLIATAVSSLSSLGYYLIRGRKY